MRLSRFFKFFMTTKRLMIVVALTALLLGWSAMRPYPVAAECYGPCYVLWSDGSTSTADDLRNFRFRGNSWFLIVDWPEGGSSYYLTIR